MNWAMRSQSSAFSNRHSQSSATAGTYFNYATQGKRGMLLAQVLDGSKRGNRNVAIQLHLPTRRRAIHDRAELAPCILPKLALLLQRLGHTRCDEDSIQPSLAAAESTYHAKRRSR